MLYIYTIQDNVFVSASLLGKDIAEVLRTLIKEKYIGKVLPKEGLCVSFSDFHVGQTVVYPGEGDLLVSATIDLLVFRPIKDEVLLGTISKINEDGIEVDLNFIKAFIPDKYLMKPAVYDKEERTWLWRYENVELFYDVGETLRFKAVEIAFEQPIGMPKNYFVIVFLRGYNKK